MTVPAPATDGPAAHEPADHEPAGAEPAGTEPAVHGAAAGGPAPFVRVRVWDLPVRLIHWLLVLDLVALSVTGFLIGTPVIDPGGGVYWMSWTRTIHKITAYLFIALIFARLCWHLRSPNPWSRWTEWIPSTRERLGQIIPSLRFYMFLTREAPPVVGHNPLAGLTYCVLYTMFGVEIVTGLVLWGVEGTGWASWLTGWLLHIVPLPTLRLIHHLIMWLTWGFMIHHLYSAILVDRVEGTGVMTSIFSGNKFLPKDHT
ncbi:Ni/Fe-hydrogenase, b-type cytochrome subunit [Parafrankia sp. FMc2]|uniref:Ni/Fe-hydrogenase, b-type cytochrome subunit n=1 Tax=Parafrankia sp. FMc2 TaxID=3233196 RepID=UPI0034D3D3DE